jgi:hypothetical protein
MAEVLFSISRRIYEIHICNIVRHDAILLCHGLLRITIGSEHQ